MTNAIEIRDIPIIDLPGVFLHSDLEEHEQVLMVMEGRLADLLAIIKSKPYKNYIITDQKEKKIFYVRLQKALHVS